jgi:hypothetical protein
MMEGGFLPPGTSPVAFTAEEEPDVWMLHSL